MEKQFTPGPWAADKSTQPQIYSMKDGKTLAICYAAADDKEGANARLMAAGPEMFEMLEEIIAMKGMHPTRMADSIRKAELLLYSICE